MADIKKVKQGIKNCIANHECYQDCPYFDDCHDLKKPMFADLANDALSVIEELQKEIERLQQIWIPVSERPPEDGSDILVYFDDGEESRIVACNYANGVWFDCVFNTVMIFKNITHWMPLPKSPKKG